MPADINFSIGITDQQVDQVLSRVERRVRQTEREAGGGPAGGRGGAGGGGSGGGAGGGLLGGLSRLSTPALAAGVAIGAVAKAFSDLSEAADRYNQSYAFQAAVNARSFAVQTDFDAALGRAGQQARGFFDDLKSGVAELLDSVYALDRGDQELALQQQFEAGDRGRRRREAANAVRGPLLQQIAGDVGLPVEQRLIGAAFDADARNQQITELLARNSISQGQADSLRGLNEAALRAASLAGIRDQYSGVSGLTPTSVLNSVGPARVDLAGPGIEGLLNQAVQRLDTIAEAIRQNTGTAPVQLR